MSTPTPADPDGSSPPSTILRRVVFGSPAMLPPAAVAWLLGLTAALIVWSSLCHWAMERVSVYSATGIWFWVLICVQYPLAYYVVIVEVLIGTSTSVSQLFRRQPFLMAVLLLAQPMINRFDDDGIFILPDVLWETIFSRLPGVMVVWFVARYLTLRWRPPGDLAPAAGLGIRHLLSIAAISAVWLAIWRWMRLGQPSYLPGSTGLSDPVIQLILDLLLPMLWGLNTIMLIVCFVRWRSRPSVAWTVAIGWTAMVQVAEQLLVKLLFADITMVPWFVLIAFCTFGILAIQLVVIGFDRLGIPLGR